MIYSWVKKSTRMKSWARHSTKQQHEEQAMRRWPPTCHRTALAPVSCHGACLTCLVVARTITFAHDMTLKNKFKNRMKHDGIKEAWPWMLRWLALLVVVILSSTTLVTRALGKSKRSNDFIDDVGRIQMCLWISSAGPRRCGGDRQTRAWVACRGWIRRSSTLTQEMGIELREWKWIDCS